MCLRLVRVLRKRTRCVRADLFDMCELLSSMRRLSAHRAERRFAKSELKTGVLLPFSGTGCVPYAYQNINKGPYGLCLYGHRLCLTAFKPRLIMDEVPGTARPTSGFVQPSAAASSPKRRIAGGDAPKFGSRSTIYSSGSPESLSVRQPPSSEIASV